MAFKILTTPGRSDLFSEITDPLDLGMPFKNTYLRAGERTVTNDEYFAFARQLFCTDNIRNNPNIFVDHRSTPPTASNPIPTFTEKFLEKIPADLHQFAFLVSYMPSYGGSIIDSRLNISWDSYSAYIHGVNAGSQTVDINSDVYWAGMHLYLVGVSEFFQGAVWRAIKGINSSPTTTFGNNLFRRAGMLMSGYKYIRRALSDNEQAIANGSMMSAGDVVEMMNDQDPASYTLKYTREWGYILVAPINIRNKSSLYQVFPASQDVLAILGDAGPRKKIIKRKEKSIEVTSKYQRFYGVEVELATNKTPKEMIDLQGDPIGFILKNDASITGTKSRKYECVTMPLDMVEHRKLWTRFFNNVGDKGDFDVSTQTNNGMHVHISKSLFTKDHLKNFTWFITAPEHREFIIQISQRSQESFDRWSGCPSYSAFAKHSRAYNDCVNQVTHIRGAVNVGNTRNKPTVEVRIFKGIVSCAEVLRNLEFVDSVFEFTRPVKEGGFCNYANNNVAAYYAWVKSTPKTQYKLLRADLYKLDMPAVIRKARVLRLVFNMNDPEAIVKTVNSERLRTKNMSEDKRFIVDKVVFATVTRLVGKRAFSVDEEGMLTCVLRNQGRLAHLDEKILKGYDKRQA